jgi:hypothetical protein
MIFAFYGSIFTFILVPQDSNNSCLQEADAAAELVLETLKSREQMLVRCISFIHSSIISQSVHYFDDSDRLISQNCEARLISSWILCALSFMLLKRKTPSLITQSAQIQLP